MIVGQEPSLPTTSDPSDQPPVTVATGLVGLPASLPDADNLRCDDPAALDLPGGLSKGPAGAPFEAPGEEWLTSGGASSGEVPVGDNDVFGAAEGTQAVLYGAHQSVRMVDRVDWDVDPPEYHSATHREVGILHDFFTRRGRAEYEFVFRFANRWSDTGGHDEVFLLIGLSGDESAGGSDPPPDEGHHHHHDDEHGFPLGDPYDFF